MAVKKIENELSPMMSRYIEMKEKHKDCILFYRLGDFYELFFEDAIEMSKVLDLTLTGKSCGLEERAPMCGIPYHAADNYIAKLVKLNYKVAICEQLSAPTKGSLVDRDVIRIITPGTIVDDIMLDDKVSNYIASIYKSENNIGLSYCEITTGEFITVEFKSENSINELNDVLVRIMPTEIICKSDEDLENLLSACKFDLMPKFTYFDETAFDERRVNRTLMEQFNDNYKLVFEIDKMQFATISAGALIDYLNLTQKRNLCHINKIKKLNNGNFMVLDVSTRKNLEIMETLKDRRKKGSLIAVIDKTKTSMGARQIKAWLEQPLCDCNEINARLDAVSELVSKLILRDNLNNALNKINDIERITGRISYGNFTPKDAISLLSSLKEIPNIKNLLQNCNSFKLKNFYNNIDNYDEITNLLQNAIVLEPPALISGGNFIKEGFNEDLDIYRNAKTQGVKWINELELKERELTGIKSLRIAFNRVYGYFIEVNSQFTENIPLRYIRKQTVAKNERYITDELKMLEDKLLNAEENAVKLEIEIFNQIRQKLIGFIPSFQIVSKIIAELDCLLSFADIATKNNYVKPKVSDKIDTIEIIDGRHPVVESINKGSPFVPNDTYLNSTTDKIMIITGPNMAGKSTYMRQVAVITLLAHIGCFVPAKKAEISLTDRIFTRVGASDDLAVGQSTFMVEMMEVAQILQNATSKSLVILDEIGRGTSTFDGLSIAWAVTEHLSKKMCAKTLFATHYHELTELEGLLEGVKNYKISVKEIQDNIIFFRKIVRGGANRSFGIEVASLAGVPKDVIKRAKEISLKLEETDINKNLLNSINLQPQEKEANTKKQKNQTEIIRILSELDINKITPLLAFETLCDLVSKAKE